jgi:thiol-disulfide isomerase/thioredoxin
MSDRRTFLRWGAGLAVAAVLSLGAIASAVAAERRPYDAAAFQAAQAAGKPIMVEVYAPWCPICVRQKPVIDALKKTPEFSDLTIFTVDFDSQKDLLRQFNVQKQSTLIVFNGKTEKARSTGVTDPAEIRSLLMKAKGA